jgi:hypothetical protein
MNTTNDELCRLLTAGQPADGNLVPLYSAMRRAQVVVRGYNGVNGPEPLIVGVSAAPEERFSIQAYTDWKAAAASGVQFDFEVVDMSLKDACRFAAYHRLDAVDLSCGGYGYSLNYTGMIDMLSGRAPVGEYDAVQIERVDAVYEVPATPPPIEFVDMIRELATQLPVKQLSCCCVVLGEAPPQLCFLYQPHPNRAFDLALLNAIQRWFGGKMTFTTQNLLATSTSIPPESVTALNP